MDLNHIKSELPDFAMDLRLNLESVLSEPGAPGLENKASFELAASGVRIAAVVHAVAVTLEQSLPVPLASAA